MADTITKGSTVEVSSDEPGFHGAWYVATLIDVLELSPTNKKKKKKKKNNKLGYLVKYETLYEDENVDELLTEIVDPSFVRPVPEISENGGEFEVFDVVDAYHRDGWWIGVVTKVVVVSDGGIRKYVVEFENPREIVEFERNQLRVHVDWVDSRWVVPPKKTLEQEVTDKNATNTSESNNAAFSGFTAPSKGIITIDIDNLTVDGQLSVTKRSRSRKNPENSSEMVGAVDGSDSYSRNRSIVNLVKKSRGKKNQSSSGSKGNKKDIVPMIETSGSPTIHQDSPLVEQEMIITDTCEAEAGKSQQNRKRGRPQKLPFKRRNENQQTWKRTSVAFDSVPSDLDEQPLSVWYQGLHPLSLLNRSSCRSNPSNHLDKPSGALNSAIVNNGGPTMECQQDWPFTKRFPIWAAIESLELFQNPPQKPHFSPLKKTKEDYREGLAIAHMVTFANIVQRISNLQLTDLDDIINNNLETLVELEAHGFDVRAVRARLSEMLTSKVKVGQLEDKVKKFEKELETRNLEKSTIEVEISQLEVKMKELKEKMAQTVAIKNDKDDEIVKLETDLHLVSNQIIDWKLDFEKLAAAPL